MNNDVRQDPLSLDSFIKGISDTLLSGSDTNEALSSRFGSLNLVYQTKPVNYSTYCNKVYLEENVLSEVHAYSYFIGEAALRLKPKDMTYLTSTMCQLFELVKSYTYSSRALYLPSDNGNVKFGYCFDIKLLPNSYVGQLFIYI
jgi:hypothetical protein